MGRTKANSDRNTALARCSSDVKNLPAKCKSDSHTNRFRRDKVNERLPTAYIVPSRTTENRTESFAVVSLSTIYSS